MEIITSNEIIKLLLETEKVPMIEGTSDEETVKLTMETVSHENKQRYYDLAIMICGLMQRQGENVLNEMSNLFKK